jgi:hypothetical protein
MVMFFLYPGLIKLKNQLKMKTLTKILGIVILTALTTVVVAQTEQGNILIGGSSSFSTGGGSSKMKTDNYEGDPTKFISFNLSPKGGIFVIDNLIVGASLPISVSRNKNDDYKVITSGIDFLPFARYYFLEGNFRPAAEAFFGFGFHGYKTVDDGDVETNNTVGFLLGLGGGVAYFINDRVAIDALLKYGFTRLSYSDQDDNLRTLDHEIGVEVGICVIL